MLNLHYKIDDETSETRILPITKVYEYKRTRYCQFLIGESTEKGKFLAIDDRIQTTEDEYKEYHEKLLHNVLNVDDGKALVLGAGEGITGDILAQRGYEVHAVDIDGILIKAIEEHLGDWRKTKTNKKITTFIYDAVDFLEHKDCADEYDVIVFDLTEPNVPSESCYMTDFILRLKKILKKDGVFCFQNGSKYEKNPIMEKILAPFEVERLTDTYSEKAEWKFGALKFL